MKPESNYQHKTRKVCGELVFKDKYQNLEEYLRGFGLLRQPSCKVIARCSACPTNF